MNFSRTFLLVIFCILSQVSISLGQEQESNKESETKPHHRITGALSHAHVGSGVNSNGKTEWLNLPAFGLDYDYILSPKWAIGLHTDIVIENFLVEENLSDTHEVIERNWPVATAVVTGFKPGKHAVFIMGGGVEIAEGESFALLRAGMEYGWEMNEHWEVDLSLMYDIKLNAYDTWIFGLGISRMF